MCDNKRMLILYALAVFLLVISGFCLFGLPWLMMGPRAVDQFAERAEQQVMGALLVAAAISLVLAPFFASGLISDAARVQVFAETLTGFTGRA